ncbi:MAG: hypothetical protein IJI16_00080 [Atopobiaceae bacterium]|nr:hypothetical protein [Atopobiaceae bacterium]
MGGTPWRYRVSLAQRRHTRENDLVYIEGGWGWTTADVYLIRLYGLKLDPEFVEDVLETDF